MPASPSRAKPRAILLTAALLTILVYLPGLGGGFVFDDYSNILLNEDLKVSPLSVKSLLQAGWSGMSGPLKRPISMISFALNYATTGDFIGAFKLTNVIIHIFNGVLMFIFFRLLMRVYSTGQNSPQLNYCFVAAVAAALWMLHPLNLTSVLYIVQRMNSLSAMFSLLALISYCKARVNMEEGKAFGRWWLLAAVPLFVTLGALSKENAVLTFPLIGLVELCFFRLRTADLVDRKLLIGFLVATILLPVALAAAHVVSHPNYLGARYAARPFSMVERLLTEGRVMWFYLALLVFPKLSSFGLYHDDYVISTGMFEPITTVFAVGALGVAVFLAVFGLRRVPMLTFAIGWYLIGHIMESSVIALELVHEHRNYLPSMGILFALSYACARACASTSVPRLPQLAAVVAIFLTAAITFLRAGDWRDPVTLAVVEAERHPNSMRAVYDLGRVQFGLHQLTQRQEFYDSGLANLERAAEIDPSSKRPLIGLIRVQYEHGYTPKTEWMTELLHRYEFALFHPSEIEDLTRLVKCRASPDGCSFPVDDILQLYHAALRNQSSSRFSRAQLMVDLAVLYVNEANDLAPAVNLLDDAVQLFPKEFNFRKIRAQVYLLAQMDSELEDEIRFMRSVTVWRDLIESPDAVIDDLETQLRLLRENVSDAKAKDT